MIASVSDYKERKVCVLYDFDDDEWNLNGVRLRGAQLHGGVHGRSRTWQAAVSAASRIQTMLQAMHDDVDEDLTVNEASLVKGLKHEGAWTLQVVRARLHEVRVVPERFGELGTMVPLSIKAHVIYVASTLRRDGSMIGERELGGACFGIQASELNLRRCKPVVDVREYPDDEDAHLKEPLPGYDIRSASLLGALRESALGKSLPRDLLLMVAAEARSLEDGYDWDNWESCVPDLDLTALGIDEVMSLLTDTDAVHAVPYWY